MYPSSFQGNKNFEIALQILTRPGLEPGISGSGGRRLIHWANGPFQVSQNAKIRCAIGAPGDHRGADIWQTMGWQTQEHIRKHHVNKFSATFAFSLFWPAIPVQRRGTILSPLLSKISRKIKNNALSCGGGAWKLLRYAVARGRSHTGTN